MYYQLTGDTNTLEDVALLADTLVSQILCQSTRSRKEVGILTDQREVFVQAAAIESQISIDLVGLTVPLDEYPTMSCTDITTFWSSPGH